MSSNITILMPVFNCEATLRIAIDSILRQTLADWELWILDDGSTDQTVRVARSCCDPRIHVIADGTGNLGLAARLNQGIDLAAGGWIARMDGDDVSFPLRLERQFAFLQEHPDVDLVGCGMIIFKGDGIAIGQQAAREKHEDICGTALRSCLLPHATWLGRTSWFRAHRYRGSHRRAEDRELLLRTQDVSRFAGLPELLYAYRVNGVSVRVNARARYEYFRALLETAAAQSKWVRYGGAAAAELLKLSIDTLALATHTERLFLRHRALPLRDVGAVAQWESLWSELQTTAWGGAA